MVNVKDIKPNGKIHILADSASQDLKKLLEAGWGVIYGGNNHSLFLNT